MTNEAAIASQNRPRSVTQLQALTVQESQALPLVLGGSVSVRRSGLIFSRPVPLNTWEIIGGRLFSVMDSSTWWIADWLAYGEANFRDRYREAVQQTCLNYQTLRNYAWVARRFEISRRRDNLSFGHHAEVTALDPPEQDYWLRKAEELGWSRNQLRQQVRASLNERASHDAGARCGQNPDSAQDAAEPAEAESAEATLSLQLTGAQLKKLADVASSQGQRLADWAKAALLAAATESGD